MTGRERIMRAPRRFVADVRGATAIEYGLIACFIFLAIVGVVTQVGINLQQPYTTANDALQ
jgi:pilus assembly protein Flp/PilA